MKIINLIECDFDITKADIIESNHDNVNNGQRGDILGDLPIPLERSEQREESWKSNIFEITNI